jgi:hypothetical protein
VALTFLYFMILSALICTYLGSYVLIWSSYIRSSINLYVFIKSSMWLFLFRLLCSYIFLYWLIWTSCTYIPWYIQSSINLCVFINSSMFLSKNDWIVILPC